VRSVGLPDILSGNEPAGSVTRTWDPGLAVDRSGDRAFVVQADAPVAEVDLATFEVRSHALEPGAADAVQGPTRHALWLGRGMLAITGSDARRRGETPAGLTLVDTRTWESRMVHARTSDAAFASGTLLAYSFTSSGSGLTGYSVRGRRRFHLYGRDRIAGVQALGRRALVATLDGSSLIEARTGRRLHRQRSPGLSLLSGDAPIF
jgi:hypothetical protein